VSDACSSKLTSSSWRFGSSDSSKMSRLMCLSSASKRLAAGSSRRPRSFTLCWTCASSLPAFSSLFFASFSFNLISSSSCSIPFPSLFAPSCLTISSSLHMISSSTRLASFSSRLGPSSFCLASSCRIISSSLLFSSCSRRAISSSLLRKLSSLWRSLCPSCSHKSESSRPSSY